jgi:hypothetical protein
MLDIFKSLMSRALCKLLQEDYCKRIRFMKRTSFFTSGKFDVLSDHLPLLQTNSQTKVMVYGYNTELQRHELRSFEASRDMTKICKTQKSRFVWVFVIF